MSTPRRAAAVLLAALAAPPASGGEPPAPAAAGIPLLEARWRRPCLDPELTRGTTADNGDLKNAARWVKRAQELYRERNLPVLPSLIPVAAEIRHVDRKTGKAVRVPLVLYRGWWGAHAYHARTGEVWWQAPSDWSLAGMATDPQKFQAIHDWIFRYLDDPKSQHPSALLENSVTGTLSSDGAFAYLVEDLAVAPPLRSTNRFRLARGESDIWGPAIDEAIRGNALRAYSLDTGRLEWEIPERLPDWYSDKQAAPGRQVGVPAAFRHGYFLGPPLPSGGRLYAVVQFSSARFTSAAFAACPALAAAPESVCLACIEPRAKEHLL